MAHLRKDPITKRWVITSTSRAAKPTDYVFVDRPIANTEKTCPFCVGREDEHIISIDDEQGNWRSCIVENKYPVLSKEPADEEYEKYKEYVDSPLYEYLAATGYHDIVIESPRHSFNIYTASVDEFDCIFDIVIRRLEMLKNARGMKYSLYFKNFGSAAGASIVHAHSQIITTPFMPRQMLEKIDGSDEYYQERGNCIYCDIIKEEQKSGARIVAENERFIAFCPFASRSPYQVSILPKKHFASILSIDATDRHHFASLVADVFSRIKNVLGEPPFNYVLSTLPTNIMESYDNSFHFSFNILPKLSRLAGFELGSGVRINSVLPEHAAEALRGQS